MCQLAGREVARPLGTAQKKAGRSRRDGGQGTSAVVGVWGRSAQSRPHRREQEGLWVSLLCPRDAMGEQTQWAGIPGGRCE